MDDFSSTSGMNGGVWADKPLRASVDELVFQASTRTPYAALLAQRGAGREILPDRRRTARPSSIS